MIALLMTALLWFPSPVQVNQAVAVLTRPDEGAAGFTARWDQPVVTYHIGVPYQHDLIYQAVAWASAHTGLRIVETTSAHADVEIVPENDNGAYTRAWTDGHGRLIHAVVQLGCCRVRPVFEDLGLQVWGPFGDRADGRWSLASPNKTLERPTQFDAWLLELDYSLPPGTPASVVQAAALARCAKGNSGHCP